MLVEGGGEPGVFCYYSNDFGAAGSEEGVDEIGLLFSAGASGFVEAYCFESTLASPG